MLFFLSKNSFLTFITSFLLSNFLSFFTAKPFFANALFNLVDHLQTLLDWTLLDFTLVELYRTCGLVCLLDDELLH